MFKVFASFLLAHLMALQSELAQLPTPPTDDPPRLHIDSLVVQKPHPTYQITPLVIHQNTQDPSHHERPVSIHHELNFKNFLQALKARIHNKTAAPPSSPQDNPQGSPQDSPQGSAHKDLSQHNNTLPLNSSTEGLPKKNKMAHRGAPSLDGAYNLPPSKWPTKKGPQQGQVLRAQSSLKSLDDEFSPVAIEAFRLVQEELQKMSSAYQRLILTESGQAILVQKESDKKRPTQIYPTAKNTHTTTSCSTGDPDCQKRQASICLPGASHCPTLSCPRDATDCPTPRTTAATNTGPTYVAQKTKNNRVLKRSFPRKIRGSFSFRGGAASDGQQVKLSVYHVRDGQRLSQGRVFLRAALFDLQLDQAAGYILGEVTDPAGKVLAVGDISLYTPRTRQNLFNPGALKLVLQPYTPGLRVAAFAANTFKAKKLLPRTRLQVEGLNRSLKANKKGVFTDNSLSPDSSFLMRATHKNHWPTLVTGIGDYKQQHLKLFSTKMVEALLDNVLDKKQAQQARQRGVVWGRVMLNGQPLQNAQVQIAHTQSHRANTKGAAATPRDTKTLQAQGGDANGGDANGGDASLQKDNPTGSAVAVYFNSFLPDKKLTHTTENGFFAFVNVPKGVASLRVRHKGQLWPANLIEVQPRHVSYVQLQAHTPRQLPVKSFDALSGAPVASHFRVLGLEKEFSTLDAGQKTITLPSVQGLMFVEVAQSKAYVASHHSVPAQLKHLHLPRLPHSWLDRLVPQDVQNVLVGFTPLGDDANADAGAGANAGAGAGAGADANNAARQNKSNDDAARQAQSRDNAARQKHNVDDGDYKVALISGDGLKPRVIYFDAKGKKSPYAQGGGGFVMLDVPVGLHTVALTSRQNQVHTQMLALEKGVNVTLLGQP